MGVGIRRESGNRADIPGFGGREGAVAVRLGLGRLVWRRAPRRFLPDGHGDQLGHEIEEGGELDGQGRRDGTR